MFRNLQPTSNPRTGLTEARRAISHRIHLHHVLTSTVSETRMVSRELAHGWQTEGSAVNLVGNAPSHVIPARHEQGGNHVTYTRYAISVKNT